MKGAIFGGILAAITDVVINIVSDNYSNPIAWVVFVVVVVLSSIVGFKIDQNIKSKQKAVIYGNENETEQTAQKNGTQSIRIKGTNNKAKQQIR